MNPEKLSNSTTTKGLAKNIQLCFVLALVVFSGFVSAVTYYKIKNDKHLETLSREADAMLALSSSYVSVYSKIRNIVLDESAPVPAGFRAQAADKFNETRGDNSHFMAKMVGLPDRYIATSPTDNEMSEALSVMAQNNSTEVYTKVLERPNDTILRTMYPSIVTAASCADCHNKIQNPVETRRSNGRLCDRA